MNNILLHGKPVKVGDVVEVKHYLCWERRTVIDTMPNALVLDDNELVHPDVGHVRWPVPRRASSETDFNKSSQD